jgi:hypothetical protein
LAPNLLGELQMPMLLRGVDQVGQERDHAFGGIPGQEQRVLDFRPIIARMRVHRYVQHILGMVEQSHP